MDIKALLDTWAYDVAEYRNVLVLGFQFLGEITFL